MENQNDPPTQDIPSDSSLSITVTVSIKPSALRRFIADIFFAGYAGKEDFLDRKGHFDYGKSFEYVMENLTGGEYKK